MKNEERRSRLNNLQSGQSPPKTIKTNQNPQAALDLSSEDTDDTDDLLLGLNRSKEKN